MDSSAEAWVPGQDWGLWAMKLAEVKALLRGNHLSLDAASYGFGYLLCFKPDSHWQQSPWHVQDWGMGGL